MALLVAAVNASTIPEWREVVASGSSDVDPDQPGGGGAVHRLSRKSAVRDEWVRAGDGAEFAHGWDPAVRCGVLWVRECDLQQFGGVHADSNGFAVRVWEYRRHEGRSRGRI